MPALRGIAAPAGQPDLTGKTVSALPDSLQPSPPPTHMIGLRLVCHGLADEWRFQLLLLSWSHTGASFLSGGAWTCDRRRLTPRHCPGEQFLILDSSLLHSTRIRNEQT